MTKSEKTRQFIIEQAAPLFNKKGMAGTSMSDIMAATKLAKGGIYGNFGSKEEIGQEVFQYLTKRLFTIIDDVLDTAPTAKKKLYALLDFYVGGCPILNFGTEADDTSEKMREHVSKAVQSLENKISKIVADGIQDGEFRKSVDGKSFAVKLVIMMEGAILVGRVQNSNKKMKLASAMLKREIDSFSV
jgi:AcrR family transcriptional regulator